MDMGMLMLGICGFGVLWTLFLAIFRPQLLMQWYEHKEQRRRRRASAMRWAFMWWLRH